MPRLWQPWWGGLPSPRVSKSCQALQARSGRGLQPRRGGTRAPSWLACPHFGKSEWATLIGGCFGVQNTGQEVLCPCHFSSTPASSGCDQPGKDRTLGYRGGWRRASPGQRSLACSSSSFLSNLLGWKVNEACLPRSRPLLSLCPDCVFPIKMGSGATSLLSPWVTAEPSSGRICCYLLHGSLCAVTVCCSRDKSGLPVSVLVLAVSLLKVKDEADIFYLYVDIYILKQPPPAFAYCNGFLRVECVSTDGDGAGETHCLQEFNHGI